MERSSTTAMASVRHGRRIIGADIEQWYLNIAEERLRLEGKGRLKTRTMGRCVHDPRGGEALVHAECGGDAKHSLGRLRHGCCARLFDFTETFIYLIRLHRLICAVRRSRVSRRHEQKRSSPGGGFDRFCSRFRENGRAPIYAAAHLGQ